jgi:hypothetical protein
MVWKQLSNTELKGVLFKFVFLLHQERIGVQEVDKRSVDIPRIANAVVKIEVLQPIVVAHEDIVKVAVQVGVVLHVLRQH